MGIADWYEFEEEFSKYGYNMEAQRKARLDRCRRWENEEKLRKAEERRQRQIYEDLPYPKRW